MGNLETIMQEVKYDLPRPRQELIINLEDGEYIQDNLTSTKPRYINGSAVVSIRCHADGGYTVWVNNNPTN